MYGKWWIVREHSQVQFSINNWGQESIFVLWARVINRSRHVKTCKFNEAMLITFASAFSHFLPVVSLISKKEVNGLPSLTSPYRISRGTPLSPSSAWTWRICIECISCKKCSIKLRSLTLSPGIKPEGSRVTGGAKVKTGATSCTSSTITTISTPAIFRLSWPGSAYASYKIRKVKTIKKSSAFNVTLRNRKSLL